MNNTLLYRRQFLIADNNIEAFHAWQHIKIGSVHLFAHPDLELNEDVKNSIRIYLLGYMFDSTQPEKSNKEILNTIISKVNTFYDLVEVLKPYVGRYVLIYEDQSSFCLIHDPLGLREVYYCTANNQVICGSQPNLLNSYSYPELGVNEDRALQEFYKNEMRLVRNGRLWVGDETYFKNIKHLTPNHYLDLNSKESKRYWPNRKLETIKIDDAVEKACAYLKGALKAVNHRFETMMAVTSGVDSRSLLAASRGISHKIYYFINKEPPLTEKSADIRVPTRIFSDLHIPFHIHEINDNVDHKFKEIFLNNVFMASELILPTIYNVYSKEQSQKFNLLGVGEIGRDYFGEAPSNLDGYYLARSLKYKQSEYATMQCEKWLVNTKEIAKDNNVDIMRLFLWENLLGNWGVVGNSESDIAIEEFDPYNSHYIYEIMLSLEDKHFKRGIFEDVIKSMWPELSRYPFNPPDNVKDRIKAYMKNIGIFHYVKKIVYYVDKVKYRTMQKNIKKNYAYERKH